MERSKREIIDTVLGIVLIACLIQAGGWIRHDSLVFPGLAEILKAFFRLIMDGHTYRLIATTLGHLLQALVLASAVGIPIGLAEGSSGFVYRLLRPLMILLRSVPVIVMVVIIMVMTKYDYVPLIATSLLLIPMISEAVCEGVRGIEPELLDVYRLNCGFNARVLLQVYLPLMAGYLKQAYAGAVGMGIKMVVTTEYLVQTRNSLGKAIYSSSYFNEYQDIYAYALIMILLVLLVSALPTAFQRAKPLHHPRQAQNPSHGQQGSQS